jgi:hypothetical protein
MMTGFFKISSLAKFLLTLCSLSAFAQINRAPGQWVGDVFLVNNPVGGSAIYLIDENDAIIKEIPYVSNITDFSVPRNLRTRQLYSFWHNDVLHTLTWGANEKDIDDSVFSRFSFTMWQDDKWHYVGSYKTHNTMPLLKALPCDNGYFIAISSDIDLSGNIGLGRTPFAKLSLNPEKKEFRLVSSIDHGQDE